MSESEDEDGILDRLVADATRDNAARKFPTKQEAELLAALRDATEVRFGRFVAVNWRAEEWIVREFCHPPLVVASGLSREEAVIGAWKESKR